MNKETVKALKASINKWTQILAGKGQDAGCDNCALCQQFYRRSCGRCPVSQATGFDSCEGSPYIEWCIHHYREHAIADFVDLEVVEGCDECKKLAKAEIKFLQGLLPKKGRACVKK